MRRPEFPPDLLTLTTKLLATAHRILLETYTKQLHQAYEKGVDDGAEAMRQTILEAVQSGAMPVVAADTVRLAERPTRAPRGAVRRAMIQALLSAPDGLTEAELGQAASKLDTAVSPRSMGGELRRMRGDLYENRQGRWFLVTRPVNADTERASTTL